MRKPGQRVKDHGARQHEAEWRAYQAAWQKPINEMRGTAEEFYQLRRTVLGLNRKQTGRLLRVSVNTVLNWEHGVYPVPFYAYLALVLVAESVHYKLANEQWRDWHFIERFNADQALPARQRKHVACLVHPESGACFSAEDLLAIHYQMQKLAALEGEALKLRGEVDTLTAENTQLREMFRDDGVTEELHSMQNRLQTLLAKVNTAAVLNFRKAASG
jgi:hypothetical protein